MSARDLDRLFRPGSVALVGASRRAGSIGAVIARNLLQAGFTGPILPVHPTNRSVAGVLAYPDVKSLPIAPDLAVIATPPATVPGLIADLGALGARAVVVITAGFGEGQDARGRALADAMLEAARPHGLRIVGPNTLGVLAPGSGLNASFAHLSPASGRIGFATQSGAIVTSVIDWAKPRGIGFSHLVSLGGMLDVDYADMLEYLSEDPQTESILLHIEGVKHADRFLAAALAATRRKPVLVVKSGRHPASAKAAASHTGALAGSDAVYDAAFRRAGMLRVDNLEELFAAVETLADLAPPRGRRLGILSNGGGIGVLATDELLRLGGTLAELSEPTLAALDAVLPATWSRRNPIDIIGDAPPERTRNAVRVLLEHDHELDALLVLNCPTAVATPEDCARALIEGVRASGSSLPILTSWVGEETAARGRQVLNDAQIATYDTPTQAIQAFMRLVDYRERRSIAHETQPDASDDFEPDAQRAREIVARRLATDDAGWLSEANASLVLAAYGIDVVPTTIADSPEAAGRVAEGFEGPAVLKIASPDIVHKSDVGGVRLGLESPEAVVRAAQEMTERLRQHDPQARIAGFAVQPMIRRRHAFELIVGAHVDAQFGPVLLFGQGGTAVELIDDTSLELPPLSHKLAMELIARTRIHRQLRGYRDRAPANLDAIARTLVRLGRLVLERPEIESLDINPLLADPEGVVALDARIFVRRR